MTNSDRKVISFNSAREEALKCRPEFSILGVVSYEINYDGKPSSAVVVFPL